MFFERWSIEFIDNVRELLIVLDHFVAASQPIVVGNAGRN
jgi:hypothetical protein